MFLPLKSASAFVVPHSYAAAASATCTHHGFHHNDPKRAVKRKMVSVTEDSVQDDPWVLLEEFKVWAILNKGKYDMIELQKAISTLRSECQINIQTLEDEIASIQQSLQCSEPEVRHHANEFRGDDGSYEVDDVVRKAVFAGYNVTDEDRNRLSSAHPEDRF